MCHFIDLRCSSYDFVIVSWSQIIFDHSYFTVIRPKNYTENNIVVCEFLKQVSKWLFEICKQMLCAML